MARSRGALGRVAGNDFVLHRIRIFFISGSDLELEGRKDLTSGELKTVVPRTLDFISANLVHLAAEIYLGSTDRRASHLLLIRKWRAEEARSEPSITDGTVGGNTASEMSRKRDDAGKNFPRDTVTSYTLYTVHCTRRAASVDTRGKKIR